MAKDIIERWIRIEWKDSGASARDITPSLVPGSLSGGGKTFDEVEMTGVSDEMKNFLAGHSNSEIAAQFYVDTTATTGAFTVLMGTEGLTQLLTLQFGTAGPPATGDPEWEGEYTLLQAEIGLAGNKPVINARWLPGTSTAAAWGTVA